MPVAFEKRGELLWIDVYYRLSVVTARDNSLFRAQIS